MPPGNFSAELNEPQPTSLDPQLGQWFGFELWRCCLVRTLYSHNGRPTEEGGARLRPDLAEALPDVSADGLTWTIRIKPGLHYGPPLAGVEITARDFVRSFERLLAPRFAQVGGWYGPFLEIEGATEYNRGEAAMISGIEAPDDHTLVFRLVQAEGDFAARLATPAAGPLPPDPLRPEAAFGIAEGADGGFGRFLVSSGPYMVEGSEELDFSVPAAQRAPAAGVSGGRLTLIRNPSWDQARDDLRPAYADRIEIVPVDSVEQAVAGIDTGAADLVWPAGGNMPTLPPDVYAAFQADPARGRVHVNATSVVRFAILNVAVPPFDDPRVRRALNYAIDRQHLVDLQGGPVGSEVHRHLLPDVLEDNLLLDYDPYPTPGDEGRFDAARAEMAKSSRYDTDGDGRCDAPVCEHVRALTRDPFGDLTASVAADLERLGIHVEVEVQDTATFFGAWEHPEAKIPLLLGLGFGSNYLSGTAYLLQFYGPMSIDSPPDTYNFSMVGATADQLKRWGYAVTDVPNVDGRVEACVPLIGTAQFRCIADFDQNLTENVVPWVPLTQDRYAALVSPRVLTYGFDELTGTTALDQLALEP